MGLFSNPKPLHPRFELPKVSPRECSRMALPHMSSMLMPNFKWFDWQAKQGQDQTYWWDMCFVEMARGNVMGCDSMVTLALADPKIGDKKVRMDHIAASVSESVNAKAAFIYLQALMLRAAGDILTSAKALEAALKEDQNFYAAKQSILDLQRMYAQQQRGGK